MRLDGVRWLKFSQNIAKQHKVRIGKNAKKQHTSKTAEIAKYSGIA